MKLLIVTQAVDTDDPVLGFFCRWIDEFAKYAEHIEVICLMEGKHSLPANVRVHSLGKESTKHEARSTKNRITYAMRFLRLILKLRREYDAVFVHMNEEYALLGGLFWLVSGKRLILWRNHKQGSFRTRIAVLFARSVCHTSPDACVARFGNARMMPIGIDTRSFAPPASPAPGSTILFFGRLDPVKRADVFIEALANVPIPFHADIYGSPTHADSPYARRLTEQARPLVEKGVLALHPGVPHERTPELYYSHAVYVNLTPSGSFDKTIGEAMAGGCIVVASNAVLRGIIRPEFMVRDDDAADAARAIGAALGLSEEERAAESRTLRAYIEENHSLERLMADLQSML